MSTNHKHYVFVYGTLRKNQPNSYILDSSSFLGVAKTKQKYTIKQHPKYSIPCLLKHQASNVISGELYKVSSKSLKELDKFEEVPNLYYREEILVSINNHEYSAFCYFFSKEF